MTQRTGPPVGHCVGQRVVQNSLSIQGSLITKCDKYESRNPKTNRTHNGPNQPTKPTNKRHDDPAKRRHEGTDRGEPGATEREHRTKTKRKNLKRNITKPNIPNLLS